MNNPDIKSFVLLKYEILTSNSSTWDLCETYPPEVRSKWAWRCAADVEHLAKGHKEAEECIRVAKLYRDGLATKEELNKAWNAVPYAANGAGAYAVRGAASAHSATYRGSAYSAYATHAYYAATYAASGANSAHAAYYATYYAAYYAGQRDEKWKLYISWLIEELCEYESKQ